MTLPIEVRSTEMAERREVLHVVEQAFATHSDTAEVIGIVQTIWEMGLAGDALDMVALVGGQMVGHVLGSWGSLDDTPLVGVAPLSVVPAHQRRGVGTALVEALIERADGAGLPMLVLLGDHGYYRRFGFEPAVALGVWYRPVGSNSPHFQVRRLAGYRPG